MKKFIIFLWTGFGTGVIALRAVGIAILFLLIGFIIIYYIINWIIHLFQKKNNPQKQ